MEPLSQPINYPAQKLTFVTRRHEYGDVYTYIFEPTNPLPFIAGQYVHVRLSEMAPEDKAVREFSFASAPHESQIWFGIDTRSGSPYQKRLLALEPHETIEVFKIKSHMSWPPAEEDVVMIAGGIGVTPFRSMLSDLRERNLPVTATLVHAARDTYLYGEELEHLAHTYVATDRNQLKGIVENIVREKINAHYYIAGSPDFVKEIAENLNGLGITKVESDAFKGLSEEE